ncbi:MAG: diaminopimelate epimerase [Oscillospiraceae bacterium]|nr:diaminopimelate epimerase [Oscillospiraceae bacterium]
MNLAFTKMHGAGNDYIYLNCLHSTPENLPELARRLSDRHFSVGGDGVICICPSQVADVSMRMFNADGSEGAMCGNGIRCVGKYVYDKGFVPKRTLTVETRSGVKTLCLTVEGGQVTAATVDMGIPRIDPPVEAAVEGETCVLHPASMGNPHAVLYVPDVETAPVATLGPLLERHSLFPDRTNVEFVSVVDRTRLNIRVWERGSGETLACGTGACAALAATASLGLCERQCAVELPGGRLDIRWSQEDGHIYLTGPAVIAFEGTVCI